MKKYLLLAAAMMVAAPTFAQYDTDITPGRYKFNTQDNAEDGLYHLDAYITTGANPTAGYGQTTVKPNWNDGFIMLHGAKAQIETINEYVSAGLSIVDLGGEVGKVLCLNGKDSKFNSIYGTNIPQMSGNPAWCGLNFYSDPDNTPVNSAGKSDIEADRSKATKVIRVRLTLNIFKNQIDTENPVFSDLYCSNNQNGVTPEGDATTAGRVIYSDSFAQYDEDGEPVLDDTENYIYDPTRWMVYEFDTYLPAPEGSSLTTPTRVKIGLPSNNALYTSTIFIKSVEFFSHDGSEETIYNDRKKTFETLSVELSEETGIKEVDNTAREAKKMFDLQGRKISKLQSGVNIVNGEKVLVK